MPPPDYYDNDYIANTKWFNTDVANTDSIKGVLILIFIFAIIVSIYAYAEFIKIPVLFFLSSMMMFLYSILIASKISIVLGILMIFLSLSGFVRGALISND